MKLKKKNADQEIQNTSVSRQELLHNISTHPLDTDKRLLALFIG